MSLPLKSLLLRYQRVQCPWCEHDPAYDHHQQAEPEAKYCHDDIGCDDGHDDDDDGDDDEDDDDKIWAEPGEWCQSSVFIHLILKKKSITIYLRKGAKSGILIIQL